MGPKMRAKPLAPAPNHGANQGHGAMGMNHLQQIPVKVMFNIPLPKKKHANLKRYQNYKESFTSNLLLEKDKGAE